MRALQGFKDALEFLTFGPKDVKSVSDKAGDKGYAPPAVSV